ncbi:Crp/Fnr family transcriptional regulator [Helicobacter muridarum]|uniref:Crp/Fnr family transcriptional regulator n=1 Tax=Helicobacter muridarum TaxID=216 RepID=A0A099TWN7_9HELI|nr:Crp/Fnr family transcriptional regulator [Helicobacter muridarum]TLD98811.1 Crp/Fnr family transcriptional regulator [Helicobacter muridarum]STQ85789.1 putative transcriptional regulator [Helicobacter muridarum]
MQRHLELLCKIGRKVVYEENSILFFEGEEARNLFLLLHGRVRLYKNIEQGMYRKEQTLHIFDEINFIAEMPFFTQSNYPANAQTIQQSEIIIINTQSFKNHLQDSEFCMLFISSLCQKIQILESHIKSQSQSLQERFLAFIRANEKELENMSQRHIARHLNTNPESLSRLIKSLKKQGIIDTNKGKVIAINRKSLEEYMFIQ